MNTITNEHDRSSGQLSEERKAFMNMMDSNIKGNELDLKSVNAALNKRVTDYITIDDMPIPAILVNTETGVASYGCEEKKGPNDVMLIPLYQTQMPKCIYKEMWFEPASYGHNDREGIKAGAWDRFDAMNWVQEFGFTDETLQDLYKEKVKEHEQEAERE